MINVLFSIVVSDSEKVAVKHGHISKQFEEIIQKDFFDN